ncbi:hypothetical protein [Kitasatospora sp. NPDC056800]
MPTPDEVAARLRLVGLIPHDQGTGGWRAPDGRTIRLDLLDGITRE